MVSQIFVRPGYLQPHDDAYLCHLPSYTLKFTHHAKHGVLENTLYGDRSLICL